MSIIVTAAVICIKDKFLITSRPEGKHLSGKWEFPGGKVKVNESLQDALARELREELNVSVIVLDKLFSTVYDYVTKVVQLEFFRVVPEDINNFIPLPMDNQKLCWAKKENLKNFVFAPADIEFVEMLELCTVKTNNYDKQN